MKCKCGCQRETAISLNTDRAKGYVKGQPRFYIRGHSGRINRKRKPRASRPTVVPVPPPTDVSPILLYRAEKARRLEREAARMAEARRLFADASEVAASRRAAR